MSKRFSIRLALIAASFLGLAAITGCSLVIDVDECLTDADCEEWAKDGEALVCDSGRCESPASSQCSEASCASETDENGGTVESE